MPINVFGNSSNNNDNKIDTSLFVQKPYLRTNYIESNIEEDIDLKNQYKIKNLPDPTNLQDACSKNYVDNKFNDPSIIKNNAHIDLNDRNITNARFIQVNQLPQTDSHLTAKLYVDNAINEATLVRNNQDNDFSNYNLTNINSITLNKQAENDNEVITKAYVDQFHQENERSRRDLGIDFYDESSDLVKNNQDNDFNDNKLINIDSITVNREPSSDNELANKKYIDDELDKNTIVRFNQTLSNYLKVSVGNDIYHLTKYGKNYITDLTEMRAPNSGLYLMQKWIIVCKDKNNNAKINNFIKSTKTQSPTEKSGATGLPPIGNSFMYLESSGNNNGDNTYVKLIRTDIIQITNISFYYNSFSITDENLRAMPRFRIQILLENGNWENKYTIEKNSQFSNSSTEWTHLSLDFTQEIYGIQLIFDRISSAHADMSLSNISITHTLF